MTERERIVAYLRDAVEQGYPSPRGDARAQCEHGRFYFEDCIGCYDEFLMGKLADIENGLHMTWKPEPTIGYGVWSKEPSVGHGD